MKLFKKLNYLIKLIIYVFIGIIFYFIVSAFILLSNSHNSKKKQRNKTKKKKIGMISKKSKKGIQYTDEKAKKCKK